MNILIVDIGSYMFPDIRLFLERAGHHTADVYHDFRREDHYHNPAFEAKMDAAWKSGSFDLVFSTNFLPAVAFFCHEHHVRYISWSYDCPLNLETEEGFDLSCNTIYLYDKEQVRAYRAKGLDNVYHLPLAVNCERLKNVSPDQAFSCDISFMGTLYESTLPFLKAHMPEYAQGYIDAIVRLQGDLYGTWLADDLLTEELTEEVNAHFRKTLSENALQLTKKQLSWSLATHVTHLNRLLLLRILSKKHQVLLCTGDDHEKLKSLLPDTRLRGRISYVEEMPRLFRSSKINLNMSLRAIQSGIPLRALDIMGCGGFLLSNYQPELAEYCVPGEECILYESAADAAEKAAYYLTHEEERERIAAGGLARMQADFRYEDRIREMLGTE